MLKSIKSTYFSDMIFTYLDERQKLDLVKYNKSLQKKLNITILNYQHFQGCYIIYESKGFAKEYFGKNDELRFEGEYLNGKRNGKGKEYYDDGKLLFEGEYLNGKRNGKGKQYDWNGKLLFEGEYLNGKRKGKGKEYYSNSKLKFEGEYLNDIQWIGIIYDNKGNILHKLNNSLHGKTKENNINEYSKGKEYDYSHNLKFEGEYLNGKRNGKGKEYYDKGELLFEGEYLNDLKWNGKGYNLNHDLAYELKDGKGKMKEFDEYNGKLEFEGEYLYGKRNGKGIEYWDNGKVIFEGEYLDGKPNGKGKEYYYNGTLSFEGEYLYDYKIKGKYYINEKLEYEGEYLYGKKWNGKGYDENGNIVYEIINGNGKVKEYWDDDELIFEGEYLNGKRSGKGKEYYYNGILSFEGEYLNGKRNGKGKEYNNEGKLMFEGEFLNDKRI